MCSVIICPKEEDLSVVNTDIRCPEEGCLSIFKNSSNLEMHLIKTHNKISSYLDKKENNVLYQYYCPIQSCKYYLHPERPSYFNRYFNKMKFLKQHYLKVHRSKHFKCSNKDCNKSYTTSKELYEHLQNECGKKFICSTCNFTYTSRHSLLTHAKRKNHPVKNTVRIGEDMVKVTSFDNVSKEQVILPRITLDSSVDIAAAALSELSRKIVVKGVDKGIQTSSRRKSCTRIKKNASLQTQSRISAETQTTSVLSIKKADRSIIDISKSSETQTTRIEDTDTDNAVDSEDSIFTNLNLSTQNDNFNLSFCNFGTQTNNGSKSDETNNLRLESHSTNVNMLPNLERNSELENNTEELDLNLLDNFESKLSNSVVSNREQCGCLIQQNTIFDDNRDMETQTELNFADDPLLSHNETQTIGNSFDDIYSHNYTQTCHGLFDFVEFADIETQTGWASSISTDFVSAETQTIF